MGDTPEFRNREDRGALEDARAFNKGKGRLLGTMIGILLLAVGAFAWYLVQEQPNPYGELGKQINGLRGQYFDGFWTCALPNKRLNELKNDGDLRVELHARAASGARYGEHLDTQCRPHTRELSIRLRALIPPEDARPLIKNMSDALAKMDEGTKSYATHLRELEGPYAEDAAEPVISGLARGWYEFRKAHAQLNELVKQKRAN